MNWAADNAPLIEKHREAYDAANAVQAVNAGQD